MKGFTLIEVFVTIVILGILLTLGVSRYNAFKARARQAEARINLGVIAELQETYKYEKETYNTLAKTSGVGAFATKNQCVGTGTWDGKFMRNELGFRPKDCPELRYGYWWDTTSSYAGSTSRTGKEIFPGCTKTDKWTLTNITGKMENDPNVIKRCQDG